MNLGELHGEFDQLADNSASPPLWSEAEIYRYANEAVRDAVERGSLIEDSGNGSAVVVTNTKGVTGVTPEVQAITISATGGTFAVTYSGQKTAALAYNASAASLQTALENLSNLVPGNVVVTSIDSGYLLTFASSLGNVAAVTVDASLLTNRIVDIAVIPGKAVYPLDARILKITRARMDIRRTILYDANRAMLDNQYSGRRGYWQDCDWNDDGFGSRNWETAIGYPYAYIETIESTGQIRLVGIPSVADTLRLTVYRLPLADMAETGDVPEIRVERHYDLLDGMLARAYMKHDSEAFDPKAAAEHEARFTQHFGVKRDANVRRKQRESRSHVTQMASW